MEEYDRSNQIPRSQLFHSRLEYELEKQIAKMSLVEVDLIMNSTLSPPPSLGIRVIGVNMIHGVQDKLNIYVKRVVEDSVAGMDGRIMVNDHIIEVNGISLVGVSQKLAAQTLSNCAICPDTGTVHFVLARPRSQEEEVVEEKRWNNWRKTSVILKLCMIKSMRKRMKLLKLQNLLKTSAVIQNFSQSPKMLSLETETLSLRVATQ
eukprot:TRINITY_DN1826_c0_g1_i5.p1 TRINITY_DN1826_c0_g1~~TRINITY_DN1826_c0_g1_i5.p1  ORF type:complete len:206 (-),score=39.95 TRINITY_DN1826_c0_g1_i5:256-873(-)